MKKQIKRRKFNYSGMASIRFGGLVLGIIIVSLALKYSSACAQEGTTHSIWHRFNYSDQFKINWPLYFLALQEVKGRESGFHQLRLKTMHLLQMWVICFIFFLIISFFFR